MKLELLVVLAVVVLLPSLSEGRIVSKCELREKLDQALILPESLQKFREKILKIVICEANRRSHLNTGLVRVFGKRRTTTARPTTAVTTTTPTTTQPTTTQPTTTQLMTTTTTTTQPTTTTATTTQTTTTESTTTQTTTTQPTTTQLTTTESTTTQTTTQPTTTTVTTTQPTTTQPTTTTATTTQPTTTQPTTTQLTTTESTTTQTTTQPTTTQPTTTQPTTTQPTTTQPTTPESTTTTEDGNLRRKREADPTSNEIDESLEDMLNDLEGEVNEDDEVTWDDDSTDSEDEESNENSTEKFEEGRTRKKRRVSRWQIKKRWRGKGRPQSIGLYGLFQLSDQYFCNSGYHSSRNLCHSPCTAFTDDNIMDDINCIVRTHHIWTIVNHASRRCFFARNFFDECA